MSQVLPEVILTMRIRRFLLALLVAGFSPMASAITLGEGQILSHVGEPLSANITLVGGYSRDVRYFQVRNAECRSSIIGQTANGCDSLYEGPLTFSIRRRSDGRYFLRVTGQKDDELFYRIIIKSASATGGTTFNAFEFLPEFKENSDARPTAENDVAINTGLPAGKYGVVGGKIIEVVPDDENLVFAKIPAVQAAPVRAELSHEIKHKRSAQPVEAKLTLQADTRLQIKKSGEYADDIQALQKENGEIEEQIVLLEKHIGLLKEVIRLKSQTDAPSVSETGVVAPVRVRAPVVVPVRSRLAASNEPGTLTLILLAVVLVLSALLWGIYRRLKNLKLNGSSAGLSSTFLSPASINERMPLDLTDHFVKPNW